MLGRGGLLDVGGLTSGLAAAAFVGLLLFVLVASRVYTCSSGS